MNTHNIEKRIFFFNKQPESTSLDLSLTPLLSLNIIFNVVISVAVRNSKISLEIV